MWLQQAQGPGHCCPEAKNAGIAMQIEEGVVGGEQDGAAALGEMGIPGHVGAPVPHHLPNRVFLGVGQTFEVDVTDSLANLSDRTFGLTPFDVGTVTPCGATASFANMEAVLNGTASFQSFDSPIAIACISRQSLWCGQLIQHLRQHNRFPSAPDNALPEIKLSFNHAALGGFGGDQASPDIINLE